MCLHGRHDENILEDHCSVPQPQFHFDPVSLHRRAVANLPLRKRSNKGKHRSSNVEDQGTHHATRLTRPVIPAKTDQIKGATPFERFEPKRCSSVSDNMLGNRTTAKGQTPSASCVNGNEMTATLVEGKGVSARNRPYTVRAFIPWVGHLNAILRSGQNKVFASDKPAREAMRNVATTRAHKR